MLIQPMITLVLTLFIFWFTGIYWRVLFNTIRSFKLSSIEAINCIIQTFIYLFGSFFAALYWKIQFYNLIALENGFETFKLLDEFYLYDIPVNPINIPAFMIINRPSKDQGTPEDILKTIL